MKKSKIVLLLLLLAFFNAGFAVSATLDDYVEEALKANAKLDAAKERWHQAEHKSPQVTSLDDPMLGFAFSNYPTDTYSSDETPMTGNELRLSQKFPFPGKLKAKGDAAEAEAEWYEALYREGQYQVAYQVKDTYYQIYYLENALNVTKRSIEVVDEVIRLAETRYAVGKAVQQDVLKAHVERNRFLDRVWQLEQKRTSAYAKFQELLERFEDLSIDYPEPLEATNVDLSFADLLRAAEKQRPQLHAFQALIEKFRAQERASRLNYMPDFTVWAGYRFRDDNLPDEGTDFVSLGLSFNLPVYQKKRDAAVAEALAAQSSLRRKKQAFRSKIESSLASAFARMEQTYNQLKLYREGLIPQATQTYQASLSSYQVGKVEFLSLLDALLALYRLEIEEVKAKTDYQRSVARLEAESGVALIGASINDLTGTEKREIRIEDEL